MLAIPIPSFQPFPFVPINVRVLWVVFFHNQYLQLSHSYYLLVLLRSLIWTDSACFMNSTTKTSGSVSFAAPRSFGTAFKSDLKETFFPDDPFKAFANEKPLGKVRKGFQYFVPILGWLPKYSLKTFQYDVLAALTITSLAIPQGISYAKLCQIPPIIGLCKALESESLIKLNIIF